MDWDPKVRGWSPELSAVKYCCMLTIKCEHTLYTNAGKCKMWNFRAEQGLNWDFLVGI